MRHFKGILITLLLIAVFTLPVMAMNAKNVTSDNSENNLAAPPVITIEVKTLSKTDAPKEAKETPIDETKKYVVTCDVLRVRSMPNTESEILGKLYYGAEIKPVKILDDGWYQIKFNGKDAYVCGDYINGFLPEDPENILRSNYLIVINSLYNTLDIYIDGELYEAYSCATGKKSSPSPEGNFQIVNKITNPAWKGKVKGGDPKNPLGKRWMGLNVPGTSGSTYGIHGNSDESSIGKNVSGGCVRMHNADVEHVFEYLPYGTEVIISSKDATDSDIASDYGFFIY